jgi:hypothetical protein
VPSPDELASKRKRWHAVLDRIPEGRHVTGVEVGVWRGIMSRILFDERPQLSLLLVDPWRTGEPGTPWMDSGSVCPKRAQGEFDRAYRRARETTEFAAARRSIMRLPSAEAASRAAEQGMRFDFVFIDGDHSYEGCLTDIRAWLPLVKPGGWIGGHDWEKPARGRVTDAVLTVFPRHMVDVDAESTWFVAATRFDAAAALRNLGGAA